MIERVIADDAGRYSAVAETYCGKVDLGVRFGDGPLADFQFCYCFESLYNSRFASVRFNFISAMRIAVADYKTRTIKAKWP